MPAMLRTAAACLLFWASFATAEDYQFEAPPAMLDIAGKTLTDIDRAGDRLVAVGERGLVILSDDNGESWRQATVPVSSTLSALEFVDDKRGWAVGHAGAIITTSDGGDTWSLQFDGNQANQKWLAFTTAQRKALEAEVQALREGGDPDSLLPDLEYALEDAQFFEEDARTAIETGPADPLLDVMFTSATEGWAVGAYGMIYRTTDAGANWELAAQGLDNPDRYHYYSMATDAGGNLYLSGEAGLLYHSNDNGASWVRHEDIYIGSLFGVAVQGDTVYAFGLRGNIFRSEDEGQSWQSVPNQTSFSLYGGQQLPNGNLVLVGAGGGVITIEPGGQMSSATQSSRATLSSVTITAAGKIILVGMDGIEFEEAPSG